MLGSPIEKSFCTTREAAVLLGVSVGTVQLWVESGLLQAWKTSGGHRRVLRDSIDRLLRKGASPVPLSPPTNTPAVASRPLNVLVVEDDASLLRLYRAHISHWPMAPELTCVDGAIAALLHVGQGCPDLLITDLNMPGMDGFHMLRELRRSVIAQQARIVVVTGLDAIDIAKNGGLPADIEVLPKPVPFDRLLAIATDMVRPVVLPRPDGATRSRHEGVSP